jgi:hypothetical protein
VIQGTEIFHHVFQVVHAYAESSGEWTLKIKNESSYTQTIYYAIHDWRSQGVYNLDSQSKHDDVEICKSSCSYVFLYMQRL